VAWRRLVGWDGVADVEGVSRDKEGHSVAQTRVQIEDSDHCDRGGDLDNQKRDKEEQGSLGKYRRTRLNGSDKQWEGKS